MTALLVIGLCLLPSVAAVIGGFLWQSIKPKATARKPLSPQQHNTTRSPR